MTKKELLELIVDAPDDAEIWVRIGDDENLARRVRVEEVRLPDEPKEAFITIED